MDQPTLIPAYARMLMRNMRSQMVNARFRPRVIFSATPPVADYWIESFYRLGCGIFPDRTAELDRDPMDSQPAGPASVGA